MDGVGRIGGIDRERANHPINCICSIYSIYAIHLTGQPEARLQPELAETEEDWSNGWNR